jgi:SRSO17 transposase
MWCAGCFLDEAMGCMEDGSMSIAADDLKRVRRDLSHYLRQFAGCIKTKKSRAHLRTYVSGQISDLPRKSVEPVALAAGVAPRSLQEFLGLHRWDHDAVRQRLQAIVMRDHAADNAIALIDETSFVKKGDKTAGVQRQYCGASGKKDNCVVTVHLGYTAGDFHALLDGDLYLSQASWDEDRQRCRAAGIPDEVTYRPKWQIALDLLDRARNNGVRFKYLAADEWYGRIEGFRAGVEERGLRYVVEVDRSPLGWTRRPKVVAPGASGRGRPPSAPRLAQGAAAARRVEVLWKRGGPSWERFHIKNAHKGPVVWEVRAIRFFPCEYMLPGRECWLLVARNVLDDEVKYFLSNAPADTPVQVLLHVAFSRWRIERVFEDGKGEIGLDHFEVRQYRAPMRHLILSMVSFLFLMQQTQRLQKKRLLDHLPSTGGHRNAA